MMKRLLALTVIVALILLWRQDKGAPSRLDSPLADDSIELVLAASWQPGFCATEAGRNKRECESLTSGQPQASRFSLHGLWPDDLDDAEIFPCNCDSGPPTDCRESRKGGAPDISAPVMERLRAAMPGVESGLHRHEWVKHGACYEDDLTSFDRGADPDEYFSEAIALLDVLNTSPVRRLFTDNLGGRLTRAEIRDAFDAAFGQGAGARARLVCSRVGGENVITEIRVNLAAGVTARPDLGALIQAAPTVETSGGGAGCSGGMVLRARR